MQIQKRTRKDGDAYIIQFRLHGRRRSLFLPKRYNAKQARRICDLIGSLRDAIETERALDKATANLLDSQPADVIERLRRCDLIEPSRPECSVATLWNEYFNSRNNASEGTRTIWQAIYKRVARILDLERDVNEITISEWKGAFDSLRESYSQASISATIRCFKTFFNWAVDAERIEKNPLDKIKSGTTQNKERELFIERETIERLLAVANDDERALLVLYRYGGLRASEALLATWNDIDFKKGTFKIHSPKTKNKNKSFRVIPLFPELRELLPTPKEKNAFIVQSIRVRTSAFEAILRLCRLAKIQPWERLIQNLRSSRSIEINKEFGAICESEWLGHTSNVAQSHYLHVTEKEFQKALEKAVD